jgi:ribosomal protein L34
MSDTVCDVVALMRCDAVVARLFRGEGLNFQPWKNSASGPSNSLRARDAGYKIRQRKAAGRPEAVGQIARLYL